MKKLLPYTCTIKRVSITNTDWEDIKSYTTIYSNIKCRVYRGLYWDKWIVRKTDLWVETKLWGWKVILWPEYTNIRIKDVLEYDSEEYIIKDFRDMKLFSRINHIALICEKK